MIGSEYFGTQLRLAIVVVPVALYFLILGLLNSRKHPQLITARQDIVLLMAALSPLFILPAIDYFPPMVPAAAAMALVGLAAGALLVRPAGGSWVAYNLTHDQACEALRRALAAMDLRAEDRSARRIDLPDEGAYLEVSSFALLRNVSIRLRHARPELSHRLGEELAGVMQGVEAQTSSMAMGLLVVATALLVAPVFTAVHRAPEIVRILTDLLH